MNERPYTAAHVAFEKGARKRYEVLRPIVQGLADGNPQKTVMLMFVNSGHFPLLVNFACAADRLGIPWRSFSLIITLDKFVGAKIDRVLGKNVQQWRAENVNMPRVFIDIIVECILNNACVCVNDRFSHEL